jgi:hypothetical protein
MVDHLYRKPGRNNWQVRLDIPARLRHAFVNDKGKPEGKKGARIRGKPKRVLVKTLKTANRTEAKHEAAKVVAQWRDMFKRIARGEPEQRSAEWFLATLRAATTQEKRDRILEEITDEAYDVGSVNVEHIGMDPYKDPEAQRFYAKAVVR